MEQTKPFVVATRTPFSKAAILGLLTLGGVTAIGGAAWYAYSSAAASMRLAAFDRLTSLREAKRREITNYLQELQTQTAMLSRMPWIVDAAEGFGATFDSMASTESDKEDVATFYREQVYPRLVGRRAEANHESLLPTDPRALAAQAQFLARNPHAVGEKDNLVSLGDNTAYSELHGRNHPEFRNIIESYGFYDLFLIDVVEGRIVYSVFKEIDFGSSLEHGPHRTSGLARAFRSASKLTSGATFVDFSRYAPSYFAPAAFVASPIRSDGQVRAVFAVQVPVDHLNRIMTGDGNWKCDGLGASGETYLVGQDRLMRTDSRFYIEDPLKFFEDLRLHGASSDAIEDIRNYETSILFQPVDSEGVAAVLAGESGTRIFDDYRGIPVLSSFAPITVPGVNWAILSEIDKAEAFAPINALRGRILSLTVIVAFLLVGLSAIVSIAISRVDRLTREKDRIDHDLGIARSIQQGLLPKTQPQVGDYDIAGWSQPADATGGDYYDWQELPDRRLALTLADVTGHGIGPALVTAVCRAYARASLVGSTDIGATMTRINNLLHADLPSDRFVTFVVGLLSADLNKVELLSAGHGPLFIYRATDQRVESFGAHGIPFGIDGDTKYGPADNVVFVPGDILVLVTDGFFEWQRGDGERFGIDRLTRCIERTASLDAESIITGMYESVREFAGGTTQDDDLTAIVIKRKTTIATASPSV